MREIAAAGLEHLTKISEKPVFEECGGADSGAPASASGLPSDLAEVEEAWLSLTPKIKAAIVSLIRAAKSTA